MGLSKKGSFKGSYKGYYKDSIGVLGVLRGSWDSVSKVISTVIGVLSSCTYKYSYPTYDPIVTKCHDPPSRFQLFKGVLFRDDGVRGSRFWSIGPASGFVVWDLSTGASCGSSVEHVVEI